MLGFLGRLSPVASRLSVVWMALPTTTTTNYRCYDRRRRYHKIVLLIRRKQSLQSCSRRCDCWRVRIEVKARQGAKASFDHGLIWIRILPRRSGRWLPPYFALYSMLPSRRRRAWLKGSGAGNICVGTQNNTSPRLWCWHWMVGGLSLK